MWFSSSHHTSAQRASRTIWSHISIRVLLWFVWRVWVSTSCGWKEATKLQSIRFSTLIFPIIVRLFLRQTLKLHNCSRCLPSLRSQSTARPRRSTSSRGGMAHDVPPCDIHPHAHSSIFIYHFLHTLHSYINTLIHQYSFIISSLTHFIKILIHALICQYAFVLFSFTLTYEFQLCNYFSLIVLMFPVL